MGAVIPLRGEGNAPGGSRPFTWYARVFDVTIEKLRELHYRDRWFFVEAIYECDRKVARPITWKALARRCKADPADVSKALRRAERLGLVRIERARGEDGGDVGVRLRFPWGPTGAPNATPGGVNPPTPGGVNPPTPGGANPPTPGRANHPNPGGANSPTPGGAKHPNPDGATYPIPPSSPQPKQAAKPRAHAVAREGAPRDADPRGRPGDSPHGSAREIPDRDPISHPPARPSDSSPSAGGRAGGWGFETIKPDLERFPRTPPRGGLASKWFSKLAPAIEEHRATLDELHEYFAWALKHPEIGAASREVAKFPLAVACLPEWFTPWLRERRRARELAAKHAAAAEARRNAPRQRARHAHSDPPDLTPPPTDLLDRLGVGSRPSGAEKAPSRPLRRLRVGV